MCNNESLAKLDQALVLTDNSAELVTGKGCGQNSLYMTEYKYI